MAYSMSNGLLYHSNIPVLYSKDTVFDSVPGIEKYKKVARYFDENSFILDRTNVITMPFRVKNSNPLPAFDQNFSMSYRDCVEDRMVELDQIHQHTGKKFRLLYSGGIDSSGIFAAFIEYYGASKTRDILEICCSKESIDENPWLWNKFIRKENFDIFSSHDHNNHWTDNRIILMGEGNDQLFGRADYNQFKSNRNLYSNITVDEISKYLNRSRKFQGVEEVAEVFIKLSDAAPIPITNTALLVWWTNFNLAWNGLMYRVLGQARSLPADTIESGLFQFYNTNNFQRWSLKYHFDNPISFADPEKFKIDCKDMIIDILDIPEYRNKGKFNSFPRVHYMKPSWKLIDTALNVYKSNEDYLKFVQPNSFG